MQEFLANNIGTIIVATALAAVITLIVVNIIRKKLRGQCASCSCGRDECPNKKV